MMDEMTQKQTPELSTADFLRSYTAMTMAAMDSLVAEAPPTDSNKEAMEEFWRQMRALTDDFSEVLSVPHIAFYHLYAIYNIFSAAYERLVTQAVDDYGNAGETNDPEGT